MLASAPATGITRIVLTSAGVTVARWRFASAREEHRINSSVRQSSSSTSSSPRLRSGIAWATLNSVAPSVT